MIDAVSVPVQIVQANAAVNFAATRIRTGCSVRHEGGSARFVALKPGVYRVSFGGNVAIPTGGAVAPILLALAVDGESIDGTRMISAPAAAGNYNNVSTDALVRVYPCGGSVSITVRNVGTAPINVQDANIVITREC